MAKLTVMLLMEDVHRIGTQPGVALILNIQ